MHSWGCVNYKFLNLINISEAAELNFRWFMPFNILITFVIGSALGWLLIKLTGAPQRLKGLILGSCAAGTYLLFLFLSNFTLASDTYIHTYIHTYICMCVCN